MFTETIAELFMASMLFLLGHLALSSNPIRAGLVARLGESRFRGIYALIAAVTFVWMNIAFVYAPFEEVWLPWDWTRILSIVLMLPACILLAGGFFAQYARKGPAPEIDPRMEMGQGIFGVTRHPIMAAIGLWAALHLLSTGDLAAIVFFGSLLLLAVLGSVHIDNRKAAEMPERWSNVTTGTSATPFAAIISGRAKLDWRGIGARSIIGGIVLYLAFLFGHQYVIGVIPWPV